MDDQVLVTTAIEDTWPSGGERVLFLGEWCRRYSRRGAWEELDHEVLPYHWDQPGKIYSDYLYLKVVYEELLQLLAIRLNEIHQVEHENRYWRILIGPWLVKFIHTLFDRYELIKGAASYGACTSVGLVAAEDLPPPNDTASFTKLLYSDLWNHGLFLTLLKQQETVDIFPNKELSTDTEFDRISSSPPSSKLRTAFGLYNKVASRLARRSDVVMYSTYLHPAEELRLCARLRQVPCVRPALPGPPRGDVSSGSTGGRFREWRLPGNHDDSFRKVLSSEIPRNVPTVFLEGYPDLVDLVASLPLPVEPRAIWTSSAHYSDDVFNAWSAQKVEEGCPLLIGQHGGFFGLARFSPSEDHECEISDVSVTWGWSEPNGHRYTPVGHFIRPHRSLGVEHSSRSTGLLVSQVMPPMAYEAVAAVVGSQWLKYFEFQCRFMEALPPEILGAFVVRTVAPDSGWEQVERWKDRVPTATVDDGSGKLENLIRSARICVTTGNGTVFQESFLMQVPTILVWDPTLWELRDSALDAFADLKAAGVFHPDPDSAAHHVSEIWMDTEDWWRSTEVQDSVTHFNERYNWGPEGLVRRLGDAIKDASDRGIEG